MEMTLFYFLLQNNPKTQSEKCFSTSKFHMKVLHGFFFYVVRSGSFFFNLSLNCF